MNDFDCENKCLRFVAKLEICCRHIRNFITILCTIFQRCRLFAYFVTVDLVTSAKITALLCHSAYISVHGKVITTEHLNEFQLRAQAVRLIENYGNSMIAKKLGHSKTAFTARYYEVTATVVASVVVAVVRAADRLKILIARLKFLIELQPYYIHVNTRSI